MSLKSKKFYSPGSSEAICSTMENILIVHRASIKKIAIRTVPADSFQSEALGMDLNLALFAIVRI